MKIQIPTNCPCCSYTLELVNDQLFCRNTSCGAQLSKKLEHFCKVLGIKGMGPKTVEKLQISDLTELFYLEPSDLVEALGSEKIAEKLYQEIDGARGADLSTVLQSFSIPLIGSTASNKITQVVDHIDEINLETCKEAGLGDKATQNLMNWLNTEFKEMKEFLPFSFSSSKQNTSNADKPTVCITGKLKSCKTKAEAGRLLEQFGYKVVESVTKTLDFLVDEANDNSSKRKKAEEYGINIINDLNQLLKKETI